MLEFVLPILALLVAVAAVLGAVSMTFQKSVSGMISAGETTTVSDSTGVQASPSVLAAQPATLAIFTTSTTGSLTMTNIAHGIVTGQRIDLFWSGGHCYGAVVGTVAGVTVPIASVSGGSSLPAAGTAVIVGIPKSVPFGFVGNNLSAIVAAMPAGRSGYFVWNNGTTDIYAVYATAGYVFDWKTGSPLTNPFAGATPTVCYFSHDNVAGASTGMQAAAAAH